MAQSTTNSTSNRPKLLHIFKPGTWTTMAGETIAFSAQDLAATARAFDPKLSKAPIVLGHPATDDPAQGWAAGLVANERGLYAQTDLVDPAFSQAVKAGRYGTVSAKFYRPTDPANPVPGIWYLRHIGMLGAQAPALKGLDDAAGGFAADDSGVCFTEGVAFSGWDDATNASLWRRIRDYFIADKGLTVADEVIPAYMVQQLEQGAQAELRESVTETLPVPATQFSEPQPEKEPTVTEQEAAQLRTQAAQQAARIAELEASATAEKAAKVHADNVAFCENLNGLPPAARGVFVAALDHLDTKPDVEFGEGDAKLPLATQLKATLSALPPLVQFGEHATKERAGEAVDTTNAEAIAARATTYQAEAARNGNQISYPHAVSQVMHGH